MSLGGVSQYKLQVNFESWQVDCKRLSTVRARCIMPMFHKTGMVPVRMSRDGGQSFPFFGKFYVGESPLITRLTAAQLYPTGHLPE